MKNFKEEVKFIDGNGNKCVLDVEITWRNGYPEFTMSGEVKGSMGQCYDSISPSTDDQRRLLKIWKKYHLENLYSKLDDRYTPVKSKLDKVLKLNPFEIELRYELDQIMEVLETKLEEFTDDLEELVSDINGELGYLTFDQMDYEDALVILDEEGISNTDVAYFLACLEELPISSVGDIEEPTGVGDYNWVIAGVRYYAGTDDEMTQAAEDSTESLIEECYLNDVPDAARPYINMGEWISDWARDRADVLASYDGHEHYMTIDGTDYYAYRN